MMTMNNDTVALLMGGTDNSRTNTLSATGDYITGAEVLEYFDCLKLNSWFILKVFLLFKLLVESACLQDRLCL